MEIVLLARGTNPQSESVDRYLEEAAGRLADRGHRVTLYAVQGSGGPTDGIRHPDVRVVEIPWSRPGVGGIGRRLAARVSFQAQIFLRLLFRRRLGAVVVASEPGPTGLTAMLVRIWRDIPMLYWLMEIQPETAVRAGHLPRNGWRHRWGGRVHRALCRSAESVVVMDRYMRREVLRDPHFQESDCSKVETIAPWPLSWADPEESQEHGMADPRMRRALAKAGVFVVGMDPEKVGHTHPHLVYTAIARGRPVLYLGPRESPMGEMVRLCGFGWVVDPEEAQPLAERVRDILSLDPEEREQIGARGRQVIEQSYHPELLGERFCAILESLAGGKAPEADPHRQAPPAYPSTVPHPGSWHTPQARKVTPRRLASAK